MFDEIRSPTANYSRFRLQITKCKKLSSKNTQAVPSYCPDGSFHTTLCTHACGCWSVMSQLFSHLIIVKPSCHLRRSVETSCPVFWTLRHVPLPAPKEMAGGTPGSPWPHGPIVAGFCSSQGHATVHQYHLVPWVCSSWNWLVLHPTRVLWTILRLPAKSHWSQHAAMPDTEPMDSQQPSQVS